MLYDITLRIAYKYAAPVATGRQVARLMPRESGGEQRLIASSLRVEPEPLEIVVGEDFFGNHRLATLLDRAHEALELRLAVRVRREPAGPLLDMSPAPAELGHETAAHRGLGPNAPHHFVGPSPRVALDEGMTRWAREAAAGAATTWETVEAVGRALHSEMRFDASATEVDTPARAAWEARHGVCQDFSHIMIACLRGLGVPAAYVSGFLRTTPPPGRPRLEGADAMHAWVRAWCGQEVGWAAYDPTNAIPQGMDHVEVARGRDYADVAPIRGVLRSAGGHTTSHAVDMVPVTDGQGGGGPA